VHALPGHVQVCLVGGAVRDRLLGRAVRERDWVVVGADAATMLRAGFRQVGRDFPVFLHPHTGEEYALARAERKTGRGHQAFVFDTGATVTLEEDLRRRDLTINAMAEDAAGQLVDPFGGRDDLARRCLRHVSDAFVEDPLRVFRVARFAAELAGYGFGVAPETLALMRRMAGGGELAALSPERVYAEFARALSSPAPQRFLEVLAAAGALAPWFADVDVAAAAAVLATATQAGLTDVERFAALCATLSPAAVRDLPVRLRVPRAHAELGTLVATLGPGLAAAATADAASLLSLLARADAFRRGERFASLLRVAGSVHGVDLAWLQALAAHLRALPLATPAGGGEAVKAAVARQRLDAIAAWRALRR
jgi:tRNA nucleotidyltransferase (CCA-adding enzyme)